MPFCAPLRGPLLHPTTADAAVARDLNSLTAETRDFAAVFGGLVVNAGLGREWANVKARVELLLDYVSACKSDIIERQDNPSRDNFVVFFDVEEDVLWGKFSPVGFMGAPKRIVRASGASTVFEVENAREKRECSRMPRVPFLALDPAWRRDPEGGFWGLSVVLVYLGTRAVRTGGDEFSVVLTNAGAGSCKDLLKGLTDYGSERGGVAVSARAVGFSPRRPAV